MMGYLVYPQYQWCQPQSPQGASAAPSPPDLQRRLCQTEQGLHQHAPNCRALHCMGVSKAVFWVEPKHCQCPRRIYSRFMVQGTLLFERLR